MIATATTDALADALKTHFGHPEFRPGQREIVQAVMSGRACLGVLPTGAGKSVCYQLPALLLGGTTLVVSPLLSLMRDQVAALDERGIAAAQLSSAQTPDEQTRTIARLAKGELRLLYVSPERAATARFLDTIQKVQIALLAIDEAHCVSEWGHDFRPDYARLGELRRRLPNARILALTATATPDVRDDIVRSLELAQPELVVRGFDRPNLFFAVERASGAIKQRIASADAAIREWRGKGSAIVYAATRASAEQAAKSLRSARHRAGVYHAGIGDEERERVQQGFMDGTLDVVVATTAFGMGIDKRDVRLVVHLQAPRSLEGYYQEVGRAGRDGAPARAILLYSPADSIVAQHMIKRDLASGGIDETQAERDRRRVAKVVRYATARRCRRVAILEHFGDPDARGACSGCDVCAATVKRPLDAEEHLCVRKMLSAVARARGLGRSRIVALLLGQSDPMLEKRGLDKVPTFGSLAALGESALAALLDALEAAALIAREGDEYPVLRLTEAGTAAMHSEVPLSLGLAKGWRDAPVRVRRMRDRRTTAGDAQPELVAGPPADATLVEKLQTWRRARARTDDVPAYVILHNRVLESIARAMPATLEELGNIPGFGAKRAAKYGAELLPLLQRA